MIARKRRRLQDVFNRDVNNGDFLCTGKERPKK